MIRFADDETIMEPKNDEIVVFRGFFQARLRLPMYQMIPVVLKTYDLFIHQLTPNAIVRLSIYIWVVRNQGVSASAEGFCRVHELHYLTKARHSDNLQNNFWCYNFAYRKDTKSKVLGYLTKWPMGWTMEWFYMKADSKGREEFKGIVRCPMRLNFDLTRLVCNMGLGSLVQVAQVAFSTMVEHIGTRDLVQEFLANEVFPALFGWGMPKAKKEIEKWIFVRLLYRLKEQSVFKHPCADWLKMIEVMCNEILGNFTKKEDQLMTAAFGDRGKQRLNMVMDALKFEYPNYPKVLEEVAAGVKRNVRVSKREPVKFMAERKKRNWLKTKTKKADEGGSSHSGERSPPSKN
jgi:hypothetical protein